MSTPASAESNRDRHMILQLLLNVPQLAQYYHFDERPERLPLKIANVTAVDFGSATLLAAGKPAILTRSRDDQAFEITACDFRSNRAEIRFLYPVEGLIGQVTFKKVEDKWSVDQIEVGEGK